jgi:hypothetical protein
MNSKRWQLYYKLDENKRPVPCSREEAWGDQPSTQMADTSTEHFRISTIFLCIDHGFSDDGPPICFETMVFDKQGHTAKFPDDDAEFVAHEDFGQWRYATYEDAMAGHQQAVDQCLVLERSSDVVTGLLAKIKQGAKTDD